MGKVEAKEVENPISKLGKRFLYLAALSSSTGSKNGC